MTRAILIRKSVHAALEALKDELHGRPFLPPCDLRVFACVWRGHVTLGFLSARPARQCGRRPLRRLLPPAHRAWSRCPLLKSVACACAVQRTVNSRGQGRVPCRHTCSDAPYLLLSAQSTLAEHGAARASGMCALGQPSAELLRAVPGCLQRRNSHHAAAAQWSPLQQHLALRGLPWWWAAA